MGVNLQRKFVRFVRFFLMNKSYIFCALSVIIRYNNHTPTPPEGQQSREVSYLCHRILRIFLGFLIFPKVCTILEFI